MADGDQTRAMVLTEADITAIVSEMRKQGLSHICRYDIAPADMHDLMAFVRSFYTGAEETRKAFRATMIRLFVWGAIAGFIALLEVKFRWIRPLLKFITGMPS